MTKSMNVISDAELDNERIEEQFCNSSERHVTNSRYTNGMKAVNDLRHEAATMHDQDAITFLYAAIGYASVSIPQQPRAA